MKKSVVLCLLFAVEYSNNCTFVSVQKGMDGAVELLLSLVSFDPKTRATPLDVINSRFMADLIEDESVFYYENDIVKSYTAYSTKRREMVM